MISSENGDLRFRIDGGQPTAGDGHYLVDGDTLVLSGYPGTATIQGYQGRRYQQYFKGDVFLLRPNPESPGHGRQLTAAIKPALITLTAACREEPYGLLQRRRTF